MKILAKTEDGFILSASKHEIKALLAKDDSRRNGTKETAIGSELSFTIALQNLEVLETVRLSGSYDALSKARELKIKIDEIINVLDNIERPLVEIQSVIKKDKQ